VGVKCDEGILLLTERGDVEEVGERDHETQPGEGGKNGEGVRFIEIVEQEH
jgi:hypothetical protein